MQKKPCPFCGEVLTLPEQPAVLRLKCPVCDFPLPVDSQQPAGLEAVSSVGVAAASETISGASFDTISPPPAEDFFVPEFEDASSEPKLDPLSPFYLDVVEPVRDEKPQESPPVKTRRSSTGSWQWPKSFPPIAVRSARYGLYFSFWLGPVVVGAVSTQVGLLLFGVGWFFFGAKPSQMLTRAVLAGCIPAVMCPGCHEAYSMTGRWSCSCGFTDYRDRHLFAFRCKLCKSFIGRINCPCCDATLMV